MFTPRAMKQLLKARASVGGGGGGWGSGGIFPRKMFEIVSDERPEKQLSSPRL